MSEEGDGRDLSGPGYQIDVMATLLEECGDPVLSCISVSLADAPGCTVAISIITPKASVAALLTPAEALGFARTLQTLAHGNSVIAGLRGDA